MKSNTLRYGSLVVLALFTAGPWPAPPSTVAQVYLPPPVLVPVSPQTQRASMANVQSRVQWLQNSTRTAPNYGTGGDGLVWRSLQELRFEYNNFTRTLTMQQAEYGGNDLAELSAGLDILQEGIGNFQQDVAAGRMPSRAMRDMCQLMSKGADMWLREFNRVCAALRVGRF